MAKKKQAAPAPVPTKAKVDFARNELNLLMPLYLLIRDAIMGEVAIKGMIGVGNINSSAFDGGGSLPVSPTNIILAYARRYLPMPNETDQSTENQARYKAYVTRAIYYNATGRTLEGMTGQIFLRDPIVEIPTELDIMKTDATGSGVTLDQFSALCVRHTISYSRTGILVDFPVTSGATTKAQMETGEIRPTLTVYNPWDIINWRTGMRGAKKVLTMVTLREVLDDENEDGFQLTTFEQYRVLKLDAAGNHYVELYHKDKNNFTLEDTLTPKDAKGQPLTEIPFHFIGAQNNDSSPDRPLLYDLASLNIGHYRNSADYEESCFMVGQPTPVFTGLDQSWVTNILKGYVGLGARSAIPLPTGATAELLQAQPNSMPLEAMKQKEEQMVSIGAKLVQLQRSSKSATEQIIETTSESSPLANVSKNVSSAIVWALTLSANFVGATPTGLKYELNKDFDLTSMTADDQNAVIMQWQKGALCYEEMRTVLRKAGTASIPDADAKLKTQQEIDDGLIPDPAMESAGAGNVPPAKGASDAGGPQPKPIRRQSKPAGSK